MRKTILAITIVISMTALAGCSDSTKTEKPTGTDAAFNEADVAFATEMIPHHAQALQMVDLTVGRTLDPEFQALVDGILATQGPEIETMVDLLDTWGQPIPETVRDHVNGDGDGMDMDMSGEMPGMMSPEQMMELGDATGDQFKTMWLAAMVRHHEGAIEMATTEQADGKYADALALAKAIEQGQTAEIETMTSMLG